MKPKAVIFDLDSTLFNADHRLHLIQNEPKDWPEFFRRAAHDTANLWCYSILKDLRAEGIVPLFVTGRNEGDFEMTRKSLEEHTGSIAVLNQNLFMRSLSDRRKDTEIKREIYQKQIKPHYDVVLAIDDRKRIVQMWREEGILALHCSDWEESEHGQQHDKEADKHFQPPQGLNANLDKTQELCGQIREAAKSWEPRQPEEQERWPHVERVLKGVLENLKAQGIIQPPNQFEVEVEQDKTDPTLFHFSAKVPREMADTMNRLFAPLGLLMGNPPLQEQEVSRAARVAFGKLSIPSCQVAGCQEPYAQTVKTYMPGTPLSDVLGAEASCLHVAVCQHHLDQYAKDTSRSIPIGPLTPLEEIKAKWHRCWVDLCHNTPVHVLRAQMTPEGKDSELAVCDPHYHDFLSYGRLSMSCEKEADAGL
jgi:hydroxymethylpyrimidine pyrophosphatase-like HAD family hydrolase